MVFPTIPFTATAASEHAPSNMTAVEPMSFLVVGDLLEDTITRTTGKNQTGGADVELAWLRTRLDNERRDPRARGKLALETEIELSGNQQQARSVAKEAAEPADKENGAGAGAAIAGALAGSRANKVRSLRWFCAVLMTVYSLVYTSRRGFVPILSTTAVNYSHQVTHMQHAIGPSLDQH